MRRKWLGAIAMIGTMLVIGTAAVAQQEQRGGARGTAPSGAGARPGHGGPVAGARPGGGHVAPPAGGVARGGHFSGAQGNWGGHPAWRGAGEFAQWRGGHWWRGAYQGRFGAWWIVGPDWYWYPSEVAAVPDPATPPGMAPGFWYWCDTYQQYYPYVGACPTPWRQVAAE